MLTLNKEQIVKIIEADSSYNKGGRYCRDFLNNEMAMCWEYQHIRKLGMMLVFSGKELTWTSRSITTTVMVVKDDGRHLLVKEVVVDEDYTNIEFWLLNRNSLMGDIVWEYMG